MGIVNCTPDSAYADSRSITSEKAIEYALKLIQEGADIIDIGGESTRPGADEVSVQEELHRVIPVIEALSRLREVPLSIDSRKPEVVEKALQAGATMINDVTGFSHPRMRALAAESKASCFVMHMKGTPQTMQLKPIYEKGIIREVTEWLVGQAKLLLEAGVESEKIILDPGIGFGKTMEDNFELIRHVATLKETGFPVLYGTSRKSFLMHFFGKERHELLSATLAVDSYLMMQQVNYLRVHDIETHKQARDLLLHLNNYAI